MHGRCVLDRNQCIGKHNRYYFVSGGDPNSCQRELWMIPASQEEMDLWRKKYTLNENRELNHLLARLFKKEAYVRNELPAQAQNHNYIMKQLTILMRQDLSAKSRTGNILVAAITAETRRPSMGTYSVSLVILGQYPPFKRDAGHLFP